MQPKRGNILPIVLLVAVALIATGGIFYFLGKNQGTTPSVMPAPSTNQTQNPTGTGTQPPASPNPQPPLDPNVKTFSSAELGISFNYLETQNGEKFTAKQIGNKVFLYWANRPIEQGQYVEVFDKNAGDTLEAAIKRIILPSYSAKDCFVKLVDNPVAKQPTPANFVLAEIQVPTTPEDDMGTLSVKWDKCPSPYTSTNGIAYFAYDPAHPKKFVFLSIGQYGIDGGPDNLLWQSTLRFL